MRRGGRVVEGARLESVYMPKAYQGFESLSLRHIVIFPRPLLSKKSLIAKGILFFHPSLSSAVCLHPHKKGAYSGA